MTRVSVLPAATLSALLVLSGCAYVGDPKPPTLDLPSRVTDLRAMEYGAKILVEFTVPPLSTDGSGLTGLQGAQLHVAAGATGRDYDVPATAPGAIHYEFPVADWAGKQVTLTVRATGPKGKMSEPSNSVPLTVGPPLPPPSDVRATTIPEAVRLVWPRGAPHYAIFRAVNDMPMVKIADSDATEYVDNDVRYGTPYRYFVQAIDTPQRQSELSEAVRITPRDTFPPAVPAGLAGVPGVNSIELVWERSAEDDFAGYNVYRAVDGGAFERLAGPIGAPTYSDRAVQIGRRYSYTISAIDTADNESARSASIDVTAQ